MKISRSIKSIASNVAPNPKEYQYWIYTATDPSGGLIKVYKGITTGWEAVSGGGDIVYDEDANRVIVNTEDGVKELAFMSDLESSSLGNVIDVTSMFATNSNADFSAFMFRRSDSSEKPLIKIHGFDNSDGTNDLTITPTLGFGPQYDSYQSITETTDGTTFTNYAVQITKEFENNTGNITIPYGVKTFNIEYFLHDGANIASYYLRGDIMYPFESINTPLINFCNSGSATDYITINGTQVQKRNINEIQFGTSYKQITTIPDHFLRGLSNLKKADISIFENVTSLGARMCFSCTQLKELTLNFINLKTISDRFVSECSSALDFIDLSSLNKVTTIGENFMHNSPTLRSIQIGSVDWSTKTLDTTYLLTAVSNTADCILYADNLNLATKFKTKMNKMLSNWTVVINE